jgi:hypothetical protein
VFLAVCLALMAWSAAGLCIALRNAPARLIAGTFTVLITVTAAVALTAAPYLLAR